MNSEATSQAGWETGLSTPFRTVVVGVGGGGSNAVSRIAHKWRDGVEILAVNSDIQALEALEGVQAIPIGRKVTEGMGAGGDVDIGRLAGDEDRDVLRDALFGAKLVMMVACLGGGTGTGVAPLIAQIAREEGALTLCFATLPFTFEGEKRLRQAEEGLRLLAGHCDIVVRMSNDHLLTEEEQQANLTDVFSRADEMLGSGMRALSGILSQAGVINLDIADIRQLVEKTDGLCVFGYGEASGGSNKPERAAKAALKHPMLVHTEGIQQARSFMVNIIGGSELTLSDVQKIMNTIRAEARPDAHIVMGSLINEGWTSKLAVTLVVPLGGAARVQAPLPLFEPEVEGEAPLTEMERIKGGTGKKKEKQTSLNFESSDRGRFKNIEPTIYGGEDLDTPTYIRRGVKLSTDR